MECNEAFILISGHIDGQNTPQEEAALRAHLAACPDCRALLRAYEVIDRAAAASEVPAPDGLAASVMSRLPQKKTKKRSPWLGFGVSAGLAAAVLALLIGTKTVRLPKWSDSKTTEAPKMAAPTAEYAPEMPAGVKITDAAMTEAPAEAVECDTGADGNAVDQRGLSGGSKGYCLCVVPITGQSISDCTGLSEENYAAVLLYSGFDTSFFDWLKDDAPKLSERLTKYSSAAVDERTGIITVTSDYTTVTALHEWFRYTLLSEEGTAEGDVRDEINAQFSVYGLDGSHLAGLYDFPQDRAAALGEILPEQFAAQWFTGENWRLFYPTDGYQPDAEDLAFLVLIPPEETH